MNLEIYLVAIGISTVISLIWRNILDDNPKLLTWFNEIPFIGKSFICSFCYPQWISLIVTILIAPRIFNYTIFSVDIPFSELFVDWFLVSFAVLIFRPLTSLLMDASAIYKHKHQELHK